MKSNPFAPFVGPFKCHEDTSYIWDSQGNVVAEARGWGYLVGGAGLHLSSTKARELQDKLAQNICSLLNAEWERVQKENQKEEKV